jgi:acylphosphatase
MDEERRAVHVTITGRVQGVWFRAWTEEMATGLELDGWVRNLGDGSVEAVFAGTPDNLEKMVKACWIGPQLAKVENVEVVQCEEDPAPGFFAASSS